MISGVFIVEYIKDNQIIKEEFSSLYSALLFARDSLCKLIKVYSLSYLFDNKKYMLLSYLKYPDGKGKGFHFSDWKQLVETGKIEKGDKIVIKLDDIFEVIFKKNRMIRFPSLNDFFCWFSDFSLVYSFHEFNYMKELSTDKEVYIDDSFVIAYSQDDHFFMEGLAEKLNKIPNPLQVVSFASGELIF